MELETPYQIFKYIFTVDLMQRICDETYKYGLQNSFSNQLKLSIDDLQKYIGVLVLMRENIGHHTWTIKLSKTQ